MASDYFTADQLKCRCKHCDGELYIDEEFLDIINSIREFCGFPLPVVHGYRCPLHPIEAAKPAPGPHAQGRAVDIAVYGEQAMRLFEVARQCGIKRVGANQTGSLSSRYIHLDTSQTAPSPAFWTY